MKTLRLFLVLALALPVAGRAQAPAGGPRTAPAVSHANVTVTSTAGDRIESIRPNGWMPARTVAGQQATGMDRVMELRAAGAKLMKAGKYREAADSFREALKVMDGLPKPKASHATIGFYPDYVIFIPPMNW